MMVQGGELTENIIPDAKLSKMKHANIEDPFVCSCTRREIIKRGIKEHEL